jgi:hypothetical protein
VTSAARGLPSSTPARVLVVIVALVLIAGGTFLLWPRGTTGPGPTAASATPPRVPISVSASRPHAEVPAVAGAATVIGAHALGEAPIVALELWAGEELVAAHLATSESPALSARWSWIPDAAGDELLVVRAIDAVGRMHQSNAIWVEVQEGGEASVPRANLAVAPGPPDLALALPAVQASVDGCQVDLEVSDLDEAAGFTVYQLTPGGFAFTPLASLAASPGSTEYVVPAVGGTSALVIGAFDSTVEVLGPPILVDAPDDCGHEGWTGALALDDGVLVGGPSVDRAYLYLQAGTAAAVRVPAAPDAFVDPVDGTLDFGPVLPSTGASEPFTIEAWGWHDGALVAMGSGTWTPPPSDPGSNMAATGAPLIGLGTATTLHAVFSHTVPGGPCGKEFCTIDEPVTQDNVVWPTTNGQPSPERVLHWTTLMPGITSIVWQVLPYAPAPTADLTPPYIVDEGVISVAPGTSSGEYTIDFADYLATQAAVADLGSADLGDVGMGSIFWPGGPQTPLPPPSPTPHAGGGTGAVAAAGIGQIIPSSIANQAYVRIIPMKGGTPSIPSNHVRFDVVPPADPIQIDAPPGYAENKDAYTVEWSFTPPAAANSNYARCAVVTGHTDDYFPPPAPWPWTYNVGQVLCYDPPDDDGGLLGFIEDGFEAFVDLVEDVWEGISEGYAWIQDQIVKVILLAVPCKQIADDAACEALAKTALSIALASLGIPPTIPDFGAVMDGLKGDLRTLVLEAAASQFPGVAEACGLADAGQVVSSDVATCEALVDEAIDEVIEHVEAEVSASAGAATGKAYPGVIFAPDPRGIYQVPTVTMTITRTEDLPVPTECIATVRMTSTKKDHTWDELIAGWPKKAEGTVTGQPFLAETFTIPLMEPGDVMQRTVWLADPATWFESMDSYEYWKYYEALANPNRAWVLLTGGSELTFEVSGNCLQTSKKGPHVLTQSAIDG